MMPSGCRFGIRSIEAMAIIVNRRDITGKRGRSAPYLFGGDVALPPKADILTLVADDGEVVLPRFGGRFKRIRLPDFHDA